MEQHWIRFIATVAAAVLISEAAAAALTGKEAVENANAEQSQMGEVRSVAWSALKRERDKVSKLETQIGEINKITDAAEKKQKEGEKKALEEKLKVAQKTRSLADKWHTAADTAYAKAGATAAAAGKLGASEEVAGDKPNVKEYQEAAKASKAAIDAVEVARIDYAVTASAQEKTIGDALSERVLLQIGLVTLNPFKITRNESGKFELHSDSATARGYLQISFTHAWAWLSKEEREENDAARAAANDDSLAKDYTLVGFQLWPTEWLPDDFDVRLGYTFPTDDTSGSTVVGSGDLSGDLVVGNNLYRGVLTGDSSISFNFPQIGIGLVSGREVLDIHTRGFVGMGLTVGTPVATNAFGSQNRRVLLLWRGGWSTFEVPNLEGDSNEVAESHGEPEFKRVWDGIANEFEFRVPVGPSGYITATGGFYNNANPNPWTFQIGYSVPLERVGNAIGGFVGIID